MPLVPFSAVASSGNGQQGKARQGLFGTIPVTILEYKRSQRTNDNSVFIDGKFNVPTEGERWGFFQLNYKLDEFEQAFPQAHVQGWNAHYQGKYGMPAFLLGEPRQREKQDKDRDDKPRTSYPTSLKVVGWKTKAEFDEAQKKGMDGFLSGVVLLQERDENGRQLGGWNDARVIDGKTKEAYIKIHTYAIGAYMRGDQLQGSVDKYVLQGYGAIAEKAIRLLSSPGVVQGTALHLKTTISGGWLILKDIEIARNQEVCRTTEEAMLEFKERQTPTLAPGQPLLGAPQVGMPQQGVPQQGFAQHQAPAPVAPQPPRKSLGSFGAAPAPKAPWGQQ